MNEDREKQAGVEDYEACGAWEIAQTDGGPPGSGRGMTCGSETWFRVAATATSEPGQWIRWTERPTWRLTDALLFMMPQGYEPPSSKIGDSMKRRFAALREKAPAGSILVARQAEDDAIELERKMSRLACFLGTDGGGARKALDGWPEGIDSALRAAATGELRP